MSKFEEITKIMTTKYFEHEEKIKTLYVSTSMIPLSAFNEGRQKEAMEINATITPTMNPCCLDDYQSLFKAFDEYPTNIPKAGKAPPTNNTLDLENTQDTPDSPAVQSHVSPTNIYVDFKRFQLKLAKLNAEWDHDKLMADYTQKLDLINKFSYQLERLSSDDQVGEQAFSTAEHMALETLASNMESLKILHENQDVYQMNAEATTMARLKSFAEVLDYMLVSAYIN